MKTLHRSPHFTEPIPGALVFRIYGKHQSHRFFRPMDLRNRMRVMNRIHASILTDEEAARFMKHEAPRNPDWQFAARRILRRRMARQRSEPQPEAGEARMKSCTHVVPVPPDTIINRSIQL